MEAVHWTGVRSVFQVDWVDSVGAGASPGGWAPGEKEQLWGLSVSSEAEVLSLGTSPRASPKPSNPHPLTGPCWGRTAQLPLCKPKAALESFEKPLNGAEGFKSARTSLAEPLTGQGLV